MFGLEPVPDMIVRGALLSLLGLAWIILLVRVVGLRSFSKMTSFDFVMTVATGSLLATMATASKWPVFCQSLIGLTMLFIAQLLLAKGRKASDSFEDAIGNDPKLLMRDGEILEDALAKTRVSRSDLIGKLREANVLHFSEVRAVVLEATGDISVLHGDQLHDDLLEGVERA